MKGKLLALFFLAAAAPAAAARLETSVRPVEARVGDRLRFRVSLATSPAETALVFRSPADFGPFELVSISSSPAAYDFVLATFEVGVATIPALTFRVVGADGKGRDVRSAAIPVPIKSVLPPGAKDLKDIKGALRLPPGHGAAWLLAFLALAVAAGFGLRFLKRRGLLPGLAPAGPPPVPPDAAALEALEGLESLMGGPSKPYYSRLTEILKTYIEGRFGLAALDRTTGEMIPLLKELPLAPEERLSLRETLETADLAKFARFESPLDERRLHRDRVKVFVLSTKPRPVPEATAP